MNLADNCSVVSIFPLAAVDFKKKKNNAAVAWSRAVEVSTGKSSPLVKKEVAALAPDGFP